MTYSTLAIWKSANWCLYNLSRYKNSHMHVEMPTQRAMEKALGSGTLNGTFSSVPSSLHYRKIWWINVNSADQKEQNGDSRRNVEGDHCTIQFVEDLCASGIDKKKITVITAYRHDRAELYKLFKPMDTKVSPSSPQTTYRCLPSTSTKVGRTAL